MKAIKASLFLDLNVLPAVTQPRWPRDCALDAFFASALCVLCADIAITFQLAFLLALSFLMPALRDGIASEPHMEACA